MKKFAFIIFLIVFLSAAFFLWWRTGNQAVNQGDNSTKIFVIEKGMAVREIGNKLKQSELIRSPIAFFVLVKLEGKDKSIQAGDYRLSPSMDLRKVIDTLEHGTLDKWVTFQEGLRSEEYAQILKKNFSQYDNSWVQPLIDNEGYLFPDTYLIPADADIKTIVKMLTDNFNSRVASNIPKFSGLSSVDQKKIVILASLVEREGRTDEEKPVIAGIMSNRLEIGMALQIDATVQFAKGYDPLKKIWWPVIYQEDYRSVVSPYNTYLNPGLPPGPISNPGIESLKAAANPAKTPYFYYIHDSKGNVHYAITQAEHDKNVAKYIGK